MGPALLVKTFGTVFDVEWQFEVLILLFMQIVKINFRSNPLFTNTLMQPKLCS